MRQRLLITLFALLGIIAKATAQDESPYGITVCGIPVTDANKDDLISAINTAASSSSWYNHEDVTWTPVTGKMSYDPATKTLTLDGATIEFPYNVNNISAQDVSLTVLLKGENKLMARGTGLFNYGELSGLTITGDGSLTVNDFGFPQSKFTIDHTTLTITDGALNAYNWAKLVIDQSTVKVAKGIKGWADFTLINASISEPSGAFFSDNSIRIGDELAENVVIKPDLRTDPGLEWIYDETIGAIYHYYGDDFVAPILSNPHNLAVTYESSNPEFVEIDENTGKVTIVSPSFGEPEEGEYIPDEAPFYGQAYEVLHIKAIFAGNDTYKPQTASYGMYVFKGVLTLEFQLPDDYAETQCITAYYGEAETLNSPAVKVTNMAGEVLTDIELEYGSQDPDIASVDSETGVVTIKKIGETKISVSPSSHNSTSDKYYTYYNLKIKERGVAKLEFPLPTAGYYTATVGGEFIAPTLKNPDGVPVNEITYSSSVPSVATVDASSGKVTIKGVGETTITASFAGNDSFKAASASYTLKVLKVNPSVAFEKKEYTAYLGSLESFESPLAKTTPEGLTVTYASNNAEVVTVDANTGSLTFKNKPGTAVITASFAGNDQYEAASGSYTLNVEVIIGDVNLDGKVDQKDADDVVAYIYGKNTSAGFDAKIADVNGDGKVNVADVVTIVSFIKH